MSQDKRGHVSEQTDNRGRTTTGGKPHVDAWTRKGATKHFGASHPLAHCQTQATRTHRQAFTQPSNPTLGTTRLLIPPLAAVTRCPCRPSSPQSACPLTSSATVAEPPPPEPLPPTLLPLATNHHPPPVFMLPLNDPVTTISVCRHWSEQPHPEGRRNCLPGPTSFHCLIFLNKNGSLPAREEVALLGSRGTDCDDQPCPASARHSCVSQHRLG